MKKVAALILLVLALGLVPMLGHAECQAIETGAGVAGTACADESGVTADGDASNPDPVDGYVSVSSSGRVCADDNGAPGASESPTCAPA